MLRSAWVALRRPAVSLSTVVVSALFAALATLLVRQPDRLRLLAGKLVAVGGLLSTAAAIAAAVAVLTALTVAGGAGVDSGGWTTGEGALAAVLAAAAMVGFGLFGATLGFVLRSPVAAVGAGAAWLLAVELLLVQASDVAESILPGQLLTAIADGSADLAQVAVACAWVFVALGVSASLMVRRDVTA